MDDQKVELISFDTKEHKHYERSVDFYWAVGLAAVSLCVLAFILRDGLFGVLIIIGASLYAYSSWKKPSVFRVVLTNKDILIGHDLYQISKIESFRIMDIKGDKELVLSIDRGYHPMISICVPSEMAEPLHQTLNTMVKEDQNIVPHIGRRFMARYDI